MPFPREDTTPPVTNTYLVMANLTGKRNSTGAPDSFVAVSTAAGLRWFSSFHENLIQSGLHTEKYGKSTNVNFALSP